MNRGNSIPRTGAARRRTQSGQTDSRVAGLTRFMVAGAGLGGVLALITILVQSVLQLPLERIVVNGEFRFLDETMVSNRLQPFIEEFESGPDLEAMRVELEEIPWVKAAELQRRWPDLLEISVHERTPIAQWRDEALIDFDGTVFKPDALPPLLGLPRLAGPEGRDLEVFEAYRRLAGIGRRYNRELIRLQLDTRGSWTAELTGGTEVILGVDMIFDKMRRFLATVEVLQRDTGKLMARVDLRYGNGMAIAWVDGPEPIVAVQSAIHAESKLKGEQPGYGQHTGT